MEARSMLDKIPLNGKKTYVVVIITVIYAVCKMLLGEMPTNEAMMLITGALGITTIGHKIAHQPASVGRAFTNRCDRFGAALFLD